MQYFASMENTAYFYWQIDLLIESFKTANLDDKLVIGIAQNEISKKPLIFSKNITNHKQKIIHENIGEQKKYLPINQPLAILLALNNNAIDDSEFALIHPDMILVEPLESYQENIVFQTGAEDPALYEKILPYLKELAERNEMKVENLPPSIPIDGTMIFRDVKPSFFERVVARMFHLNDVHKNEEWDIAKAAWIITIYEHLGEYTCRGAALEKSLTTHEVQANLIHYRHGIPPVFNKKFYGNKMLDMMENPYDVLLHCNATDSMDFVHKLIHSCRQKK